jgi:hypothetical protein
MYFIFVLVLVIVLLYLNPNLCLEKFNISQTFQSFVPINTYKYPLINPADSSYSDGYYIPFENGYTNLPWWNTSLGNTSNMSYDLRGDPSILPRTNFVWNNGTNFPIYNQSV